VQYVMRVARVSAYLAVVFAVGALFAARSVYGAVKESGLAVGGELVKLADVIGPTSRVRVNGEVVNVASKMSALDVGAVLDRFEAMCRENGRGFDDAMVAAHGMERAFVVRNEEAHGGRVRGMVACLARDRSATMARDAADFAATGDLAKIGKLRYVVAERSAGATRTHVVTAWTEGAFHVGRMFPREGDAPGSDAAEGRPRDARRLLTASVEGAPYSVRIYDAAGSVESVLAEYDRAMPAHGWQAIPGVTAEVKGGRAFSRDGVDTMIFAGADGARSIVSIVEMPVSSGSARGHE
jgi:hypothetical protein